MDVDYSGILAASIGNFSVNVADEYDACVSSAVSAKIAENLQQLRLQKGVTQGDVATAIGLKQSHSVSLWESGSRIPGRANLKKLAAYFGVSVKALDPHGEAWDPEKPRAERALQKSHPPADTRAVVGNHVPPEAGELMEPGGLPPIPDFALFGKLLGVWRLLSPGDRRKFVEHGRTLALGEIVELRAARRKKAAR